MVKRQLLHPEWAGVMRARSRHSWLFWGPTGTGKTCTIKVIVNEVAAQQIFVLGEVRQPGAVELPSHGLGVLSAVAMAGGFIDGADKGSVVQIRVAPDGYLCREFDLSSLHEGKSFDPRLMDLQPFDIIYVTRSFMGDLYAFSRDVVGSLTNYTRLILDLRTIQDPDRYLRR